MNRHSNGQPIVILGVRDQELRSIEKIIHSLAIPGFYSLYNGRFVSAINAYHFNGLRQFCGSVQPVIEYAKKPNNTIVFIECYSQTITDQIHTVGGTSPLRVDHHHEGDVGFNIPPERFFFGASIGQLINELVATWNYRLPSFDWQPYTSHRNVLNGVHYHDSQWIAVRSVDDGTQEKAPIPQWILHIAAADHCLGAAYQGHCPQINPQQLMKYRTQLRAQDKNKTPEQIEAMIQQTRKHIKSFVVNGVADLSKLPITIYPELPEAAAREGIRVITKVRDRSQKRLKLLCMGYGPPRDFQRWIDHQRELGRYVYGCPQRGYAGAFLRPDESENP